MSLLSFTYHLITFSDDQSLGSMRLLPKINLQADKAFRAFLNANGDFDNTKMVYNPTKDEVEFKVRNLGSKIVHLMFYKLQETVDFSILQEHTTVYEISWKRVAKPFQVMKLTLKDACDLYGVTITAPLKNEEKVQLAEVVVPEEEPRLPFDKVLKMYKQAFVDSLEEYPFLVNMSFAWSRANKYWKKDLKDFKSKESVLLPLVAFDLEILAMRHKWTSDEARTRMHEYMEEVQERVDEKGYELTMDDEFIYLK